MPIDQVGGSGVLHLRNDQVSYVMRVLGDGSLGHLHFGAALPAGPLDHLPPRHFTGLDAAVSVDRLGGSIGFEVPTGGRGDFRSPAVVVAHADGSRLLDLRYVDHETAVGKPELPGLPSVRAPDAETLTVQLQDEPSGVSVEVSYSILGDLPVVCRSSTVLNAGAAEVRLESVMSASLDLPDDDWVVVQLSGAWAREFELVERPLAQGSVSFGSVHGRSGHDHKPFVALRRPQTDEDAGEVIGMTMLCSGDFVVDVEVSGYSSTRARIGIHPDTFSWLLRPGERFVVPEAILVYAAHGLEQMSDAFHGVLGRHVIGHAWRDRPRQVLANSWESTFFDVRHDRVSALARDVAHLGAELFVLDDGWFGRRDDDTSSLGDWTPDERKLPHGLSGVADELEERGLALGLWMEPEMVSPDSDLFREHPSWAIGVPGRERSQSRHQLVLDLTRSDVVDHLFETMSNVLSSAPIDYLKWDMNRSLTEPHSAELGPERQGEFSHRYVLGLYDLYRRITTAFPHLLIESCASGAGRFDPGLLAFAPQTWTSSSTDPVERLRIQWGASLLYPPSTLGAHVTPRRNWIVGRETPLPFRTAVAVFGVLGFELDPDALTHDERQEIARLVEWYKQRRHVLQFGRFRRLRSPYAGRRDEAAWMTIANDGSHAIVGWYRIAATPNPPIERLRLRGLDPTAVYRVAAWPGGVDERARANLGDRTGADLMGFGLFREVERSYPDPVGDHHAAVFDLERISTSG